MRAGPCFLYFWMFIGVRGKRIGLILYSDGIFGRLGDTCRGCLVASREGKKAARLRHVFRHVDGGGRFWTQLKDRELGINLKPSSVSVTP